MTKTLIDLDDDLLPKALDTLGTKTKKETVSKALRESVRLGAIQKFFQTLGAYDQAAPGLVLVDASALAYCAEPEVAVGLLPLLVLGEVATCAAIQQVLKMAGAHCLYALATWSCA